MAIDNNAMIRTPNYGSGVGISSEFGTLIPPGGRLAAFVRATSVSGDDKYKGYPIYTTLNAGLAQCRSGQPDVVIVLPGHTENFSVANSLSNLVAGTRIVGLGHGTNRPTFTWTLIGATVTMNVADVCITNCILNLAGAAAAVTAPITVSAAGNCIAACQIQFCVDNTQLSTVGITTTAGATDFTIDGCECHAGTSTGTGVTTHVRVVGTTRFKMYDTVINGSTSTVSVGVVQFLTTASLNVDIRRCHFRNNKAASSHAFTGMTGCTGAVIDCSVGVLDNLTTVFGNTLGSLQTFRCYTANELAENGILSTVVSG